MAMSLGEIAAVTNGELHGDLEIQIIGADTIRDAKVGFITLAEDDRLADQLADCPAAAVLTHRDFQPQGIPFIAVDDVHESFAAIVAHFRNGLQDTNHGISASAQIAATAKIADNVTVHAGAVIGEHVEIESNSVIHGGVHVMSGSRIGANTTIYPNVVLYENTVVGSNCLIHAGAVIGCFGFGYKTTAGKHQLSAQLGNVEIADDVEIGAGTVIDRGTYGSTTIGDGTKIDNLVQIGHNCRIGRHNILCAQVGIAGSTSTGDYVVMGGQVGVRDHVRIGKTARLAAKCGIMTDVPAGETYAGIPATPQRQQMVMQASIRNLTEMKRQLKALKRQIDQQAEALHLTAAGDASR